MGWLAALPTMSQRAWSMDPVMFKAEDALVSSRWPSLVVTCPVRFMPRSIELMSCGSRPISLDLICSKSRWSPPAPMLVSPRPVMPSSVSMKMMVLMAAKREPYHMVTGSCLPSVESGMQMLRVRMSVIFMRCGSKD